jgi:transcriptional regulator
MHPASINHVTDPEKLAALVAARGFALIIGRTAEGRPAAVHTPVLIKDGVLRFHLSRANRLVFEDGDIALAVVSGADAYVSPDWYDEPDQVPTWNYLSVEAEGPVTRLDDAGSAQLLDDLSTEFEGRLAPKAPWTRGKMTPGRFEAMARAITSFSMRVERLEGIEKLSRNKTPEAQAAAAGRMAALEDPGSREIAALMAAQAAARKAGSRA